jgi:hypothetical protein
MAIGALIASILGCTCIGVLVAVPLAIVVLVRGRDGRNHGKGLAIAALVISLLWVVGGAIGGYALYDWAKDLKTVDDLQRGDCITATGLTDSDADGVTNIRTVSCSTGHDGEVLSTLTLTGDQASGFGDSAATTICGMPPSAEQIVIALTSDTSPSAGDKVACVLANADGSELTSKQGS